MPIALAESDSDIQRCFAVIAQLRPHLHSSEFVARVRNQEREGYRLAFLEEDGVVRSVAGFRSMTMLYAGKTLYVDDLVTDSELRSHGHGDRLFEWLVGHAHSLGCDTFHLDSGTQRVDAHRFYLRKRMRIACFHFELPLHEPSA